MKKLLLIVSIFLVIAAIPITVFLVSQRQEIRKKAAPATTLSLVPASRTVAAGAEFSLDVQINTGENQVVAADIQLTFDPEVLEASTIINGAQFPNVLASGRVQNGAASITVGAQSTTQPFSGTGIAAVIRFRAIAPTQTPISIRFANTTIVNGLGENVTNVLTGTTPAAITVTGTAAADINSGELEEEDDEIENELTLSPTPTPKGATVSATLEIVTPTGGSSTKSDMPTIRGTAPPGSTVTLTIYSDPITVVVKTDANGNWVYTPEVPLDPGPHTIVATAQSSESGALTATESFVVATGSGTGTQSATPVSGRMETTILLISLAFFFIGLGISIPVLYRK